MNIKKATKFSILAVAIVAVLGIATVSFAAWQGKTNTALTASAATGQVDFYGFDQNASLSLGDKSIVPYNQTQGVTDAHVKFIAVSIPEYDVSVDYTFTLSVKEGNAVSTLPFMYKITTAADKLTDAPNSTDGFTAVGTAVDGTRTSGLTAETVTAGTYYLNIILDSSNNADMNRTVSFTLTLAKKVA